MRTTWVTLAMALALNAADGIAASEYSELVVIYRDIGTARSPKWVDGLPDPSPEALSTDRRQYEGLRKRLDVIDPTGWPAARKIDYLLVRSLLNGWDFEYRVVRNPSRNPGHYLVGIQGIAYTELPLDEENLAGIPMKLRAIPRVLEQGKKNLHERSPALSWITIGNLELDIGVPHGEPRRDVPPPGTIGWFRDLEERLGKHHPELVPDAEAARAALEGYRDWLRKDPGRADEHPGVGRVEFDWYLKHARLIPFTAEEILAFATHELQRMQAMLAWERHRNRKLPELEPVGSTEEYARRKEDAERHIRAFLVEDDILTVPEDVGDFTEAREQSRPWFARLSGKRNLWEEIQYRDPRPDLLHTVIPGHAFDDRVRKGPTPIRENFRDRAGREGWTLYAQEMLLRTGFLEHLPRTRELMVNFLIARSARAIVNVKLQLNEFSVEEAVDFLSENVPFNAKDSYRIDAEFYDMLRRPTYAINWYVGKVQIDRLVADRSRQLGAEFDLRQFHDAFLASGAIPVALVRWAMTGFDDEIQPLWNVETSPNR